MTATVTVIIPNYNGMKFLEPCFEALKAQTYRNFKILVVDNGSSDGSKEWLKAQGVDTIFLEENTGFSGAVSGAFLILLFLSFLPRALHFIPAASLVSHKVRLNN